MLLAVKVLHKIPTEKLSIILKLIWTFCYHF